METRPKRTQPVKTWCRPGEVELLKTAATAADTTVSEFVRRASMSEARRVLDDPREVK